MKGFKLLSVLSFILFYQANAQNTMTLRPYGNMGSDVMLWSVNPDSNMVTWPEFKMAAWTWSGTSGILRSMLDFNMGLIPPNSIISAAYLSLYGNIGTTQTHDPLSGSNDCIIKRITSTWNPAIVTWNTQPTTDLVNAVMMPASTGPFDDYLNMDVTALIQDLYINQNIYQGLMIQLNTEIYYRRMAFKSANQPDTSRFPSLTIEFSTVSINESPVQPLFHVSPNPSNGIFMISLNKPILTGHIEIMDALGSKFFEKTIAEENAISINLENLTQGIYFVRVFDAQNSYSKKLFIVHY